VPSYTIILAIEKAHDDEPCHFDQCSRKSTVASIKALADQHAANVLLVYRKASCADRREVHKGHPEMLHLSAGPVAFLGLWGVCPCSKP
jgi:hypothetical protein